MPTLPDFTSLPNATPESDRPIASFNPGIEAQGVEALGEGTDKLAQGLYQRQRYQGEIQANYAESQYLQSGVQGATDIKAGEYNPDAPSNFQNKQNDLANNLAGTIQDPGARALFLSKVGMHSVRLMNEVNTATLMKAKEANQTSDLNLIDQNSSAYTAAHDDDTRGIIMNNTRSAISTSVKAGTWSPLEGRSLMKQAAVGMVGSYAQSLPSDKLIDFLTPQPIPGQIDNSVSSAPLLPPTASNAISAAAQATGADPDVLTRIATLESGGNTTAKNPNSSASGLFQLTGDTASDYGVTDPNDPNQSAMGAAKLLQHNTAVLTDALGRKPTGVELYLAHQQGAEGALQLIQNPDDKAVDVRNSSAILNNGGTADMTSQQFMDKWTQKYNEAGSSSGGASPVQTILNPMAAMIPPTERQTMLNRARTAFQNNLDNDQANSESALQNGLPDPNPHTLQDYVRAYGDTGQAQEAYNEDQYGKRYSGALYQVKNQTPEQQQQTLTALKPDADDPDYADKDEDYTNVYNAIQDVNAARQKDPASFAIQSGQMDASPLNFQDSNQLSQQLQNRVITMNAVSKQYGVPNMPLTQSEIAQFSGALDNQNMAGKTGLLQAMSDGIKDPAVLASTLQQIRPTHPVEALAASYLGMNNQLDNVTTHMIGNPTDTFTDPGMVAGLMVKGDSLLNPTRADRQQDGSFKQFVFPEDGDKATSSTPTLQKDFNTTVGSGYAGNSQAQALIYQGTRAVYAALAADAGVGQGNYDADIGKKAINMVVGNVTDHNGDKVIPPYGMSSSDFLDAAKTVYNARIATLPGAPKFENSNLMLTDTPGIYKVRSGTEYLRDASGQAAVLDVNNASAAGHVIVPAANAAPMDIPAKEASID